MGWLAATIVLGSVFLGGQLAEYGGLVASGFTIGTNVHATLFYTMTGFHGVHVLGGLVLLVAVLLQAGRRRLAGKSGMAEAAAYYWHFVDAVWLLLFATLYLL